MINDTKLQPCIPCAKGSRRGDHVFCSPLQTVMHSMRARGNYLLQCFIDFLPLGWEVICIRRVGTGSSELQLFSARLQHFLKAVVPRVQNFLRFALIACLSKIQCIYLFFLILIFNLCSYSKIRAHSLTHSKWD